MQERGMMELIAGDPAGGVTPLLTRRKFLFQASAFSAYLGLPVAFPHLVPQNWVPVAFAASTKPFVIAGKNGLRILNDRPVNAETPAHLLDDDVTPNSRLFVRNNGIPPVNVNPETWRLTINGESASSSKTYSLASLKSKFENIDLQLTLECGGNGRKEFVPPASGNQWSTGAVGCPTWQGVRLRDVLLDVGIQQDAVYLGFYGADTHLSGDLTKSAISRGVPIAKALEEESMIAWGMNNQNLHPMNGHPLRLLISGWPGSVSGKWLNRLVIRNQIHDGAKMLGNAYRVPANPVAPGTKVAASDMRIIEAMPVKSLITYPESGLRHNPGEPLSVRGHAWAGDQFIKSVSVSADFGQTWQATRLSRPVNKQAWQHFETKVRFPGAGYYEVWAKATDSSNLSQPMVLPGWNPKGYLNNAAHRVAVYVA